MKIQEPTGDQCNENAKLFETETQVAYAIWYPTMGGYVGKCVVVLDKPIEDSCIEAYVWHNGDFPFGDDTENPVNLHHCSPEQFIEFGQTILRLQGTGGAP